MSLEHSLVRGGERCAFTVSEFCNAHRISRSKFYLLKNKGLGLRVTDVDGKQVAGASTNPMKPPVEILENRPASSRA